MKLFVAAILVAALVNPAVAAAEADPIIPGLRLPDEEFSTRARMSREQPSDLGTETGLRLALRERLEASPRVRVEVVDGVARFSGRVRSHEDIDSMLATALMVDGVADIRSDVSIDEELPGD